jgi:HD-GYP domain-containing protein (c-di-GMP phosphodiesterase class II)
MTEQRRISMSDIVVGEPLAWDVYGEGRRLLLRKGHLIENARQVEELVERGLYVDAGYAGKPAPAKSEPYVKKQEVPSALRFVNLANKRLERLLYNLNNEADAQGKILEVVKALTFAADINADVVLASILLNQNAANYAIRHCVDTAIVSMFVARTMKKTAAETSILMAAALTMNIGMLRLQDQLQDRQDPLSEKEMEIIKAHPQESVAILKQCGIDNPDWLSYVLLHHANEDGSGYPAGEQAGKITQNVKILALAERYCACVSIRKYRKTLLPNAALREVFLAGGKASDPMLAAYFIKELGTHPPGSFVRLQNGEIGVVTRKGKSAMTPIVHSFIGPRGAPLTFPIQRDTDKDLYAIRELLAPGQATMRFSMQQLWGEEASL